MSDCLHFFFFFGLGLFFFYISIEIDGIMVFPCDFECFTLFSTNKNPYQLTTITKSKNKKKYAPFTVCAPHHHHFQIALHRIAFISFTAYVLRFVDSRLLPSFGFYFIHCHFKFGMRKTHGIRTYIANATWRLLLSVDHCTCHVLCNSIVNFQN